MTAASGSGRYDWPLICVILASSLKESNGAATFQPHCLGARVSSRFARRRHLQFYPATVHCPKCCEWFCEAHAEDEHWLPCALEPGDEGGEDIDRAYTIPEFKVKHMMIANVKGQFSKVSGVLTLDESKLADSRVEATIEAGSIETRDAQRNTHLKSADFFHVETFPT